MQLAFHLSLLLGVVTVALALIMWKPGPFPRPIRIVVGAMVPFFLMGTLCLLLLSGTGIPTREWAVPAGAVLAVGVGCRSVASSKRRSWGFLAVSLGLCVNFTSLVHGEFTANPGFSRRTARAKQSATIASASAALKKSHAAGDRLPEGPLSAILHEPFYDKIEGTTVEHEWHTPLTGLYRVRKASGSLWCPGGEVMTSGGRLEWRPIVQGKECRP